MNLELHATPEEVMRAVEALNEFCQTRRIAEKTSFGLAVALEECASNIVNHALRRDARQMFRVTFEHTGHSMVIELRDHGPEFNPTQVPISEQGGSHDDDPPGGWGIQLVRRYTDEMRYAREGRENVLRLIKALDSSPAKTDFASNSVTNSNRSNPKNPMALQIRILKDIGNQQARSVTVKLTGSLDTATAPELESQLAPVLAGPVKEIVFDLAELKFISSAGLRIFSIARKQLKERGGQASFVNLQPQIQEVFEIIRSLPGVTIFKDMAELDRYLAGRQRAHLEQQ